MPFRVVLHGVAFVCASSRLLLQSSVAVCVCARACARARTREYVRRAVSTLHDSPLFGNPRPLEFYMDLFSCVRVCVRLLRCVSVLVSVSWCSSVAVWW